MTEKMWITTLPKIGIRPTIDGCYSGVRESLEVQVMKMAESAVNSRFYRLGVRLKP